MKNLLSLASCLCLAFFALCAQKSLGDTVYIPVGCYSAELWVYASGHAGVSLDFTASSADKWLAVMPTSGNCMDAVYLFCSANQRMPRGYYATTVYVDFTGVCSASTPVIWQNGFIYMQDFDSLETDREITDLDSQWTHPVFKDGTATIKSGGIKGGNYLECAATSAFATQVGLACTSGLAGSYNLKFTFWVKCLDWGADLHFGNVNSGQGMFEIHKNNSGTTCLKCPEGTTVQNSGNLLDWTKVSYVINTMKGNTRLLECTFGDGEAKNLNALVSDKSFDIYDSWRAFIPEGKAKWGIDNLSVECIEVADSELDAYGGGIANLGTNEVSMTVCNKGQGYMEYLCEVTEGSEWLSLEGAMESSICTGIVCGTASKELTLKINREALGNAYGRATVKVTSGEMEKSVQVFAQSGSEEGYTFYASDFESDKAGSVSESDPAWSDCGEIVSDGSNQCLKISATGPQECLCSVPDGLYGQYDFRYSCRIKFPNAAGSYGPVCFGNETLHSQGEYWLDFLKNGELYFDHDSSGLSSDIITNTCPRGEWIDFGFTYNADPLDRKLLSLTFGNCTYRFKGRPIDASDCGWFEKLRIGNSCKAPWLIDDIRMEAVPKDTAPPVMTVSASSPSLSFYGDEATIAVSNLGGQYFDFQSEVISGADYLSAATNGTCFKVFRFKAKINRKKLGLGFYRPKVRITSDIPDSQPVILSLGIQSGNEKDGYIIYASDFDNLELTSESEGAIKGELSSQDSSWIGNTSHNRIDVAKDPAGSSKKVAKIVNANDWSAGCGYNLLLDISSNVWDKFDAVYAMKMYVPDSFVQKTGQEHPAAIFRVSQDDDHRQCEFSFALDQSTGKVKINPEDIANTEWWSQNVETMEPVASNSWFDFRFRFNCKLLNQDHKTLKALLFGENEYLMEGNDSDLTYPGGISEPVLFNEAMPKMKLWCDCDNAGICLDNVSIALVPKDLPEPALLGLLALIAALLGIVRRP